MFDIIFIRQGIKNYMNKLLTVVTEYQASSLAQLQGSNTICFTDSIFLPLIVLIVHYILFTVKVR